MRQRTDEELEQLYQEWLKTTEFPEVDTDEIRSLVMDDLNKINSMSVEEYTLYQKWEEINRKYPSTTSLFGDATLVNSEQTKAVIYAKNNIWFPDRQDPDDYLNLEPELIYANDLEQHDTKTSNIDNPGGIPLNTIWTTLRIFIHTQMHAGQIGRAMNFLVRDKVTQKFLGVITISGDFLDMTARDEKIGWTREQRTAEQRIQYTAIGSTIVPTQPLGFNYVGGKLLALLCLSDVVQEKWKELYGKPLVGMSTTSLYGKNKGGHGMSQYDNLKHWKKMGYSKGTVSYQLSRPVRDEMRKWLMVHKPRRYWDYLVASDKDGKPAKRDATNRSNQQAYAGLGIPSEMYSSFHERGIYFSRLYQNTDAFLRDEIPERELVPLFNTTTQYLVELWKDKYARQRVKSLTQNDRLNLVDTLFYDDMIGAPWESARDRHLTQVGR